MRTKTLMQSFVLLAIFAAGIASAFAQQTQSLLKDKKVSVQFKRKPIFTVIGHLIQKYDVAIGLEESVKDEDSWNNFFEVNRTSSYSETYESGKFSFLSSFNRDDVNKFISIDFNQARLEEVIDFIVSQMDGYEWSIKDEVVNIIPKKDRDPRLKELSETKIRAFGIEKGNRVAGLLEVIEKATPEFAEYLERNDLKLNSRLLSNYDDNRLPSTIFIENLTFVEVLNRATAVKRGGWIMKIRKGKSPGERDWLQLVI